MALLKYKIAKRRDGFEIVDDYAIRKTATSSALQSRPALTCGCRQSASRRPEDGSKSVDHETLGVRGSSGILAVRRFGQS